MRKKPWQNDNNSQLIKKFCFGENKKERKNVPEKKIIETVVAGNESDEQNKIVTSRTRKKSTEN